MGGAAVTFLRPDLLYLLPAAALLVLAGLMAQWRRRRRLAAAYGGYDAARRLTGRDLRSFPATRLVVLVVAASALSLVAAGVERDRPDPPPPPTPVDLVVAVDVSHSMSGGDVGASRIERARELVAALLDEEVADRVALTLFADWPLGLVPLTHDAGVVEFFTPWISPELVTLRDQGTGLASVLAHAGGTWRARPREGAIPVLLIVSDGEVHGTQQVVLDAVAEVADSISVWTAGVGSEAGAPLLVPGSDGAPLLDEAGDPVVAAYDPTLLREIAELGGGGFHDVSDDGGRRALVSELRRLGGEPAGLTEQISDPTAWLVLLALVLLVLDALMEGGVVRGRRERQARGGGGGGGFGARRGGRGEGGGGGDGQGERHGPGRRRGRAGDAAADRALEGGRRGSQPRAPAGVPTRPGTRRSA
jgi:Ca-activated chloride channel homolog